MSRTITFARIGVAEQEVVVRLDRQSKTAHVSSTWPSFTERLIRRWGPPERVTRQGDAVACVFWTVPISQITFRTPRRPGAGNRAGRAPGKPFFTRTTQAEKRSTT